MATKTDRTNSEIQALQAKLAEVQAENEALKARINKQGVGRTTLPTWKGHAATALIRSLALLGANAGAINRALVKLDIVASPATIVQQRRAAIKEGKEGALLSKEDETELTALIG
jgi:hypothetical protein